MKSTIKNILPYIHKNSVGCLHIIFHHSLIAPIVHLFFHKIAGTDKNTASLSKSFNTSNQKANHEKILHSHHNVLAIHS